MKNLLFFLFMAFGLFCQAQANYTVTVVDGKTTLTETVTSTTAISSAQVDAEIAAVDAEQQKLLDQLKVLMDRRTLLVGLSEKVKAAEVEAAKPVADSKKETPAPPTKPGG